MSGIYLPVLIKKKPVKNFHCQNERCRAVLGVTDGEYICIDDPVVFSKLLSYRKKTANPLYCVKCHRFSHWTTTKRLLKVNRMKKRRF